MTALAGTITSNTDTKVLTYSGSNDIGTLFNQGFLANGTQSPYYIECSIGGTAHLNRVVGIYQLANNSWSIQLATALTGASSTACNYVFANLIGYSIKNDGGASGTIDGVTIKDGTGITIPPLAPAGSRYIFQDALLVVAASTDFLIVETS